MSAEAERVAEEFVAAWSDATKIASFFADGAVWRDVGMPAPMTDRAMMEAYVQAWITAMPDLKGRIVGKISDGDSVAAEIEFTGTNTGPMQFGPDAPAMPATGKQIHGKGTFFGRVANGKFVEIHTYPDMAGMMMQFGMMASG